MKSNRLLLLAALGLGTSSLRADDPVPARVLTLDASGHPRADLNLGSTHVTGTLDAARLPAGIGSAFLAAVTRPTGSDGTALDHVVVTGITVGEVRQMIFTSGLDGFEGGTDFTTGYPFTSAAATYRLVTTPGDPSGDKATSAPDTIPTPAAGKVWRLVSAALSNGDVVLPNHAVLGLDAPINTGQGGGGINLSQGGGSINLSQGGGSITTGTAAGMTLGAYGFITTADSGYIATGPSGFITTGPGGTITTGAGGYILTGDGTRIDTSAGGSLVTNGGTLVVSADIVTNGSATITTNDYASITTSDYAPITTSGDGSIHTSNSGYILTAGNGYIATGGDGHVDTTGGSSVLLGGHGSPEYTVAAQVGSLYTDQDGGAGAVLYVKESGGNTSSGWVAK